MLYIQKYINTKQDFIECLTARHSLYPTLSHYPMLPLQHALFTRTRPIAVNNRIGPFVIPEK